MMYCEECNHEFMRAEAVAHERTEYMDDMYDRGLVRMVIEEVECPYCGSLETKELLAWEVNHV